MSINKAKIVIYWCRRDFRLVDNPALFEAIEFSKKQNLEFLPIFILDEGILQVSDLGNDSKIVKHANIGYPRRDFLSSVLSQFVTKFEYFEIFLGNYAKIFDLLSQNFEVYLFANEDIEPYSKSRDTLVKQILDKNNGKFYYFEDQISVNKDLISQSQKAYSVFTPFKNAVWQDFLNSKVYSKVDIKDLNIPKKDFKQALHNLNIKTLKKDSEQKKLQKEIFTIIDKPWAFELNNNVDKQIIQIDLDQILERPNLNFWASTEEQVLANFETFLDDKIFDYKDKRDDMGLDTEDSGFTSKMSVALKWGLVSSRTLKQMLLDKYSSQFFEGQKGLVHYISELIWREFYRYILNHQPSVLDQEFSIKYRKTINWLEMPLAKDRFLAWINGKTGYPIVDAAMKQIAKTGWMHNRSRMIVASILTKNLGIDWRWGQEYFRAVLLDLDEASNNGGWQWASSTGSDPKPIRIFNPYLQAQNYDKNGKYQQKWLPQDYFNMPKEKINWTEFNKNPEQFYLIKPLIEHKLARQEALQRYKLATTNPVRDYKNG